ncbi:MAG: hypothetical protein ACYTBJ_13650 [Planctomycetota bacterium]
MKDWEETISPAQPPEQLNEDFLDNIVVGSDSNSLTVEYPYTVTPDNSFSFELRELTLGEPLNIGGGALECVGLGTAYLDVNQTPADDAAYRFYDTRFQPMSKTSVSELENYNLTEPGRNFRHRPFPAVRFGFHCRDVEDIMFHGLKIFDARTHKPLSSGCGLSRRDHYRWFNTKIPLWHRAPVDVVIDVSYGPTKTFEFTPQAGEGFEQGSFNCRLLHVFEDVQAGHYSSSSRGNTVSHEFYKAQPGEEALCFLFVCQPTPNQMPVSFEFLDIHGNILRGGGSSTSGHIHQIYLQQPLEKVALIRARYHTRRDRVVIHLPYIPGLPRENNAIDNLFDVHIPYVRLHDAGQVGEFLLQTLQLSHLSTSGPTPPVSINSAVFPLDFSGVTIRDIALRYAEGAALHVEIKDDRLRREYPVSFFRGLQRFLKKIFP